MAGYLTGKVVLLIGDGSDAHRGVAVALAEAGADVAVGGPAGGTAADGAPMEFALHSIANELWAIGRRSTVATIEGDSADAAIAAVTAELGQVDLVLRLSPASA
jgi:hypothetical protein